MIEFKTDPFEHQLTGYNLMENKRNFALFCEMGTGKSKMLIDDAARLWLQKRIDLMFIICPNGLQQNWILREIPMHLALDDYKVGYSRSGMGKKETVSWERIVTNKDPGMFKVLAINIDQLVSFKNYVYYKELISSHKTLLGIDESQRIKNPSPQVKRSNRTVLLGTKAVARRIASGTPMPNGPLDLFNQFKFLNPLILGFRTYTGFKTHHAVIKQINLDENRSFPKIIGYKNIKELKERMKPVRYAVRLAECVDMPPLIYEDKFVDLTPQQNRMYQSLLAEAVAAIDNPPKGMSEEELIVWLFENPAVVSKNALSTSIRLVQVLGGHVPDNNGEMHELDNNKIKILLETIEDEIDKKFMIVAQFRPEIKAIVKALKEKYGPQSVVEYHGGVNAGDKVEATDLLQTNDETRFIVGQWQSLIGITLTAATRCLVYSPPYHNWEHYIQSIYRIFRIGQHHKVVVTHLVSENKADSKILKSITEKGQAEASVIFDEDVQVKSFLDYQMSEAGDLVTQQLLFGDD